MYGQNKEILGSFYGNIGIGTGFVPVTTQFEYTKDSLLIGKYKYGGVNGAFLNCVLKGQTITCDWKESKTSKGQFEAIFDEKYALFIGIWHYYSGGYGGAWTGRK